MEQLDNFQKWINSVLTTIIGVSSGYFVRILNISHEYLAVIIVVIIVIVVISRCIEVIMRNLVDKFLFLRKMILGKHFIEGYWFQQTVDIEDNHGIFSFGVVKITFEKNAYRISGETFDENGKKLGAFNSEVAKYDNYKLLYSFEGTNTQRDQFKTSGNVELRFTPTNQYPIRLLGTIFSNIRMRNITILSDKIERPLVDKIDGIKPTELIQKLREEFCFNLFASNSTYHSRPKQ